MTPSSGRWRVSRASAGASRCTASCQLHGAAGVLLIDDYGHHPREIAATLEAVRDGWPERRLVVAFQPHRYTRTRDLFEDFAQVLSDVGCAAARRGLCRRRDADRRAPTAAPCAAPSARAARSTRCSSRTGRRAADGVAGRAAGWRCAADPGRRRHRRRGGAAGRQQRSRSGRE